MISSIRNSWYNYKSEIIFGVVMLALVVLSTYLSQFIPDTIYDNVLTPVLNICTFTVAFVGAWFIFRHSENLRIRRIWGLALLMWGLGDLSYLICYLIAPMQLMNIGAEHITVYELLFGNLLGWVMVLYPTETLRPRWMTWKVVLWQLLPMIALVALDYVVPISLWPLIALYPYALLVMVLTHIRKYRQWCEDNFSTLDNIDERWIIRYCIMLAIIGINYVYLCSAQAHTRGLTQQWFVILMLVYSTEQIMYRKDPWQCLQTTAPETESEDESDEQPNAAYKESLEAWLEKDKPYLNPDFQLIDLRQVLPLNRSYLSRFINGAYGCGDGQLLVMTTNGNERQTIQLQAGWNWTSFNLIPASDGILAQCMNTNEAWRDSDLIKDPSTRKFSIYSQKANAFVGTLSTFDYKQIYMISSQDGNTMHISGTNLPADSMKIKVRGDGQWSPMPCLLKQVTPVTEALSGYYDHATPGDMLKSHDHFAYFSEDKKWEGDLTTMRPGEGYLFRRLAPGSVEIAFYNRSAATAPKRESRFSNPVAATNMTMIAKVSYSASGLTAERSYSDNGPTAEGGQTLRVYVNDELAAVAEPITITNDQSPITNGEALYFLTIQSDQIGELRFEINGEPLAPVSGSIDYSANSHHGSLQSPIVLKPADETGVYKILENQRVIIIRNGERYDMTGAMLSNEKWRQ